MYLALKGERLSTIQEIAERYGISKNHLMKVVNELHHRGHIDTLRGKGGGIRLRRDPGSLRLGDLVRESEQDLALVECFAGGNTCRIPPACTLKGALAEGMQAFFGALNRYTLADLVAPEKELTALLQMDRAVPTP